jgi:hypothetical protein
MVEALTPAITAVTVVADVRPQRRVMAAVDTRLQAMVVEAGTRAAAVVVMRRPAADLRMVVDHPTAVAAAADMGDK